MVARNGTTFLDNLKMREQNNYQFDFLKPQHSLYSLFQKLVEQFQLIFFPTPEIKARLDANMKDKNSIFDRIMHRVEYAIYEAEQKKKVEEKIKQENGKLYLRCILVYDD